MGEPMEMEFDEKPDEQVQAVFLEFEQSMLEAGNSGTLAQMYRQAYDDVEELNKQLKYANAKKEALAQQLYDRMVSEGLATIRTEDGTFTAETKEQCSIIRGAEERAFELLESVGLGNIIKRAVNWQTLNKVYKNGELQDVIDTPDVFQTWTRKAIRIRRS